MCETLSLTCQFVLTATVQFSEDETCLSLVPKRTGNETMLLSRGVFTFQACENELARDIKLLKELKGLSKLCEICMSMHVSVR